MAVHIGVWLTLLILVLDYFNHKLTVNPIQAMEQRTGKIAITLLVLSLACTPLNTLFRFRQALTVRRALGLYAFMVAAIHVLIFVGLDYTFQFDLLLTDVGKKAYIIAGLLALLSLIPLAVTSTKWSMKKLGKNWKRLHMLIYFTACLAILHFAWAVKGDLFRLKGDIQTVFYYGLAVALLLVARIPPVRHFSVRLRSTIGGWLVSRSES
jgi:methionine sulfoxide reductase heme-binding subunit